MNRVGRFLFALSLILLCATTGSAQQLPTLAKGFDPAKLYQFNDIDDVNVFNGNVTLSIPIGSSYPLNGGFSYSLSLNYNSKVWDLEDAGGVVHTIPGRRANAGLGWVLSLGRLFDPYDDTNDTQKFIYEAPDGSEHQFCPTCTDPLSMGGSLLRLRDVSAGGVSAREVDSPDGIIRHFEKVPSTHEWRLTSIRSAASSDQVTVTYPNPASTPCVAASRAWKIDDSQSRSHYVCFVDYEYAADDRPMVERVILKTVGGGTATWRFIYQVSTVLKGIEDNDGDVEDWTQQHDVPLLTEVQIPDGSTSICDEGDCSRWQMEYCTVNQCTELSDGAGALQNLRLPTGGGIAYEYSGIMVPSTTPCEYMYGGAYNQHQMPTSFASSTTAVKKRTRYDGGNGQEIWTYTYARGSHFEDYVASCRTDPYGILVVPRLWDEFLVTIQQPSGDKVVNHFSIFPPDSIQTASSRGIQGLHYSLPYGLLAQLPANVAGGPQIPAFLSQEMFDCDASGANCALKQRTYVREKILDPMPVPPVLFHRPEYQRTVYEDPTQSHFIDVTSEDWDGYGHFEKVTTRGNVLGTNAYESRTVSTDYLPNTTAWLLNLYGKVEISQPSLPPVITESHFNATTGLLLGKRLLAGATRSANDVIELSTYDVKGNLTAQRFYGGDNGGLPTGTLSSFVSSPSGTPDYTIAHTYSPQGARLTSQYSGTSFYSYDVDVDVTTGLVVTSRDTAGEPTALGYDRLGRLISSQLPGEVVTSYIYDRWRLSNNANVLIRQSSTSAGVLERKFVFDGLGRVINESFRSPDGSWSTRETTYDSMGRVASVKEPGATSSTTYAYDWAGRAISVTKPDNKVVQTSYRGVAHSEDTVQIGSAAAGPVTTRFYDTFGRVASVIEYIPPGDLRSEYQYDAADRLTLVQQRPSTGYVQRRNFAYDGRGFLLSETHPEGGTTLYQNYDARGHAWLRIAADPAFNQHFTFDSAERITKVEVPKPPLPSSQPYTLRVLKEFQYGTANQTGNFIKGKLRSATRYNYDPDEDQFGGLLLRVEERDSYGTTTSGRQIVRETIIDANVDGTGTSWTPVKTFSVTTKNNDAGLLKDLAYPTCVGCGLSSGSLVPTYTVGRATSLEVQNPNPALTLKVLEDVEFWPSGAMKSQQHGNAIVDEQTLDESNRPRRIRFGNAQPCVAPTFTLQPSPVTIPPGGSTSLSVAIAGTPAPTIQWREFSPVNNPIPGATSTTYVASPLVTTTYVAIARNDCNEAWSDYVTVTVSPDCEAPYLIGDLEDVIVDQGSPATLRFGFSSGTGPITITWYQGNSGDTSTPVGTGPVLSIPSVTQFKRYWARLSNPCGAVDTVAASVTPRLPMSGSMFISGISASKTSATSIGVTWTAVTGAHHYKLERRASTGTVAAFNVTGTSYSDTGLPAGVFIYRVRAMNEDDSPVSGSPFSSGDPATTLSFLSVAAGQPFDDAPLNELLTTVNYVRAANGWPAVTWASVLPSGMAAPAAGVPVYAEHMRTLRRLMNEGLAAAAVPTGPFTDAPLDANMHGIKAQHVTELQARVQ